MQNYRSSPSVNENDLAIIERTDYASQAISKGAYVHWNGKLRTAKADILQGAELSASLFDDVDSDGGALNQIADHLAQATEWTYVGSKSGSSQTDSITLPSSFNELHIVSTVGTGMSHTNSRFVYNILYDELDEGETYYYENGFGWDGKSYRVWIDVSRTSVKGGYANFGNVVKTHEVKVWYR